jgi:hypothetical protein
MLIHLIQFGFAVFAAVLPPLPPTPAKQWGDFATPWHNDLA